MGTLIQIILYLLSVLWWLIVGHAILSMLFAFNVLNYSNTGLRSFMDGLDRLLQPLYRPFRKILPPINGIDWSPFLVLVLIGVIRILLYNIPIG
ncbi:YggT family protein [Sphingomonas jaspsi]|uniref:YggT family protein n=1 Tax=Sphingomonas jaspsi TaxID=392409 RepID=UPI0004AD73E0|nr:YggT family protein [Sphingomonas jaspsi]